MKKTSFLIFLVYLAGFYSNAQTKKQQVGKPNIIIIYLDDLGWGDLGCYGAKGVNTPNIDALARKGVRFTDAHCTAATCTPSRFSLLTGSYAFRNDAAILPGDAPLLIRPGNRTLPAVLQDAGYTTGVVGKWHLGLGSGFIDWNKEITPGPLEVGFNYSFIVPATLDRVPCVYVEGHRVVNLDPKDSITVDYSKKIGDYPTGLEDPQLLKYAADTQHSQTIINGISRIGFMSGGKKAQWKDEDMAAVLLNKAKEFVTSNQRKPFFLYFSFTDIHVPRAPNARFTGKSSMGLRGDAIAQTDWSVGELMKTLRNLRLEEKTLIIFTSDNGPVLDDGYDDKAEVLVGNHKPAGPYKGGKYSAYEGGTRVPTIVYWPARIKKAKVSDALINQVDLLASLASITGQQLNEGDGPDSFNELAAWLGESMKGRETMLEESFTLSLRNKQWKYVSPATGKTPDWLKNKKVATGLSNHPQLYDLQGDPGEENNIAVQNPEVVKALQSQVEQIKAMQTRK